MKEIKCPKCGTAIQIDEKDYAEILSQVKGEEFEAELNTRVKLIEEKLAAQAALKEKELTAKTVQSDEQHKAAIKELERQRDEVEKERQQALELQKATLTNDFSGKVKDLEAALERANQEKELAVAKAVADLKASTDAKINEQLLKIEGLKKDIETKVKEVSLEKDNEIIKLTKDLENSESVHKEQIAQINIANANELKRKDEAIEYYKDLKTKMSTKLLGETLEQHCMIEFNKLRTTLYPHAEFGKDNKVSIESGSKGDFIFRDFDGEGEDKIEYISIMFDMKNEADTTATKKTNESFLRELDKDRTEKGCEYAVLVSMLEPESDFYNQGIVDMSYLYPKTYVIRPQLFVAMITLLTNAAKNSVSARRELAIKMSEQVDITNFESKLTEFQKGFTYNYNLASNKFDTAIDSINKSITQMEKVRDNLMGCQKQLKLAKKKADEVSIRKLTKDSPSLKAKFEAIEDATEDEDIEIDTSDLPEELNLE